MVRQWLIFVNDVGHGRMYWRYAVENNPDGAEGGNRTHTLSPEPDFESGASTNSATSARAVRPLAHEARDRLRVQSIGQAARDRCNRWAAIGGLKPTLYALSAHRVGFSPPPKRPYASTA